MTFVPKDVIVLPEMSTEHPGRWLAMNSFARTSLGVSVSVLKVMGNIDSHITSQNQGDEGEYICWEVQYFSNEDGLLGDPSRYRRNPNDWKEIRLNLNELVNKLRLHCLIIDDLDEYRKRFGPKKNLLDRHRFGNYHEQHGQHLLLNLKVSPATWWIKQKFDAGLTTVRKDSLYGAVQWAYIYDYAKNNALNGLSVLDIGCGTGIYTNLFAAHGANAVGIDPNGEYLEVARRNALETASFMQGDIGAPNGLEQIETGSMDIVFMSDALLFYFCPMYPGQKTDVLSLLAEVKRVLKNGGRFLSVEPHSTFYMAPWLGECDRPFTVLTEYAEKKMGINPSLSWTFKVLTEANLLIKSYRELQPMDYFKSVDPRAFHFAKQFPVWQSIEAVNLQ